MPENEQFAKARGVSNGNNAGALQPFILVQMYKFLILLVHLY